MTLHELRTFRDDLAHVTDPTLPAWLVDGARRCADSLEAVYEGLGELLGRLGAQEESPGHPTCMAPLKHRRTGQDVGPCTEPVIDGVCRRGHRAPDVPLVTSRPWDPEKDGELPPGPPWPSLADCLNPPTPGTRRAAREAAKIHALRERATRADDDLFDMTGTLAREPLAAPVEEVLASASPGTHVGCLRCGDPYATRDRRGLCESCADACAQQTCACCGAEGRVHAVGLHRLCGRCYEESHDSHGLPCRKGKR